VGEADGRDGAPPDAIALARGQELPLMPLAEDAHPIGDLSPHGSTNRSA
jgi:hypothetical protein